MNEIKSSQHFGNVRNWYQIQTPTRMTQPETHSHTVTVPSDETKRILREDRANPARNLRESRTPLESQSNRWSQWSHNLSTLIAVGPYSREFNCRGLSKRGTGYLRGHTLVGVVVA